MRVASDAVLQRAARLRSTSGKSWLQLTRTAKSREAGSTFFKGAKAPKPIVTK